MSEFAGVSQQNEKKKMRITNENKDGCFECGDMNHWKRNCPKLKNKGQEEKDSKSQEKDEPVDIRKIVREAVRK